GLSVILWQCSSRSEVASQPSSAPATVEDHAARPQATSPATNPEPVLLPSLPSQASVPRTDPPTDPDPADADGEIGSADDVNTVVNPRDDDKGVNRIGPRRRRR